MDIETQLLDTIRSLPPKRQAEIVDFVEFIKQRSGHPPEIRPAGLCQGEFTVPEDFDAPLPESVLRDFES
jgi:hypothetical protein